MSLRYDASGNLIDGFQLTGSNAKYFRTVTSTLTEQKLTVPFTTRQVTLINDGYADVSFIFDGKTFAIARVTYAYSDPAWTLSGTWNTIVVNGLSTKQSSNVANNAVFKPNKSGLQFISCDLILGGSVGIAKMELSKDNGTTWLNPSDIAGVSRSDGATGAGLNTFDGYIPVGTQDSWLTFNVPSDPTFVWALRITPTNTKNAASAGTDVYLISGKCSEISPLVLKSKESISLDIQTTEINHMANSNSDIRVVAI